MIPGMRDYCYKQGLIKEARTAFCGEEKVEMRTFNQMSLHFRNLQQSSYFNGASRYGIFGGSFLSRPLKRELDNAWWRKLARLWRKGQCMESEYCTAKMAT